MSIEITDQHPIDRAEEILTDDALAFVEKLHQNFAARRDELLAARVGKREKAAAAKSLDFLPETAELIWGTAASVIIFAALFKFAGPAIKKAMAARTERIQAELDASAAAKADAETEAANIRRAAGDIESERQRLLADADTQAAALLGALGHQLAQGGDQEGRGRRHDGEQNGLESGHLPPPRVTKRMR